MKYLLFTTILFGIISCTQKSEDVIVTGKVESQLWAPIANAKVEVQGKQISSTTDIEGYFKINANIGDSLIISLPGYSTSKLVVKSDPIKAILNYNLRTVTVNEDNSITFRYSAPNAESVQVCGNFFKQENGTFGEGIAKMEKNDEGIWSFTTGPTISELYRYEFIIDGNYTIDATSPYTIRDGEVLRNVFVVPGETGDLTMVQDVPHGTVSKIWYPSSLGYDRRMSVYTPHGYQQNKKVGFPVLYLLHGSGGDENEWLNLGRAAQILDNLIAVNKVKPMIVVMPNGHIGMTAAPGENSLGYAEAKISRDAIKTNPNSFEATFMDIVNFIDNNYNTIPDREHRAICGLSMGGGHTAIISANYPDVFGYVGLFSAAVRTYPNDNQKASEMTKEFDKKLEQLFSYNPFYWIAIGNEDFLYEANKTFRTELDKKSFKYIYVESDCGHVWKNWRHYFAEFSQYLFQK